jgi:hypothetical protein
MPKVVMQKHHRECPATDDFAADDIVHARGLASRKSSE